VVGGSQGAQALNVHVPRLLAQLDRATREGIAVVHLAGAGKERQTSAAYAALGLPAHVLPFGRDMPSLYSVADVVICRGGATTLTEVAASGCCAVSVPYPWHRDRHQLHNAMWFEQRGAGRVLEQRVLEVGEARTVIEPLLKDPDLRRAMAKRARASVPTDGAARILGELTGLTCRPEAAAPSRVQAVR
jgi:UDP-N-acetylglucosamine--N-acetylmuramyl-(pentapeptide) pyrophosphoryl-undecaprenol N-acetylglucosamine transferase